MYSVGIDIAKGKSVACVMDGDGKIVQEPFTFVHTREQLSKLAKILEPLGQEPLRIVLEATGRYHLPVSIYLKEHGFFVCVVNPMIIKKYASMSLRNVKTDAADALKLASYGLDNWRHLTKQKTTNVVYEELKQLNQQYLHYIEMLTKEKLNLDHLLDRVLPGIKRFLQSNRRVSDKDKLCDFIKLFWHSDCISQLKEEQFVERYQSWAKQEGYHTSEIKAKAIYANALEGIPTLSSQVPSTKILVQEAARTVQYFETILAEILAQMNELAKTRKEYEMVRSMAGIGEVLAPRLIAEIGDIQRFHSGKALVAYAGIDAPPYQSGSFSGTKRHISKRGSSSLRRTGYEAMLHLKMSKPVTNKEVYLFILKKEAEGKPRKVAKIAGLNKFLRIYYAKVRDLYMNT